MTVVACSDPNAAELIRIRNSFIPSDYGGILPLRDRGVGVILKAI